MNPCLYQLFNQVAWRLGRYVAAAAEELTPRDMLVPSRRFGHTYNVDREALEKMFREFDVDKSGKISLDELENLLTSIGDLPRILLCITYFA